MTESEVIFLQNNCLVAIGLGTNIEPRLDYLSDAIRAISVIPEVIRIVCVSDIYETEPVGYTEQNAFLNQVLFLETNLSPQDLLSQLQKVELELKRVRLIRWGPRTIDLDILVYEGREVNEENLVIPHPRMHERSFVGIPFQNALGKMGELDCQRVGKVVLNLQPDGVKLFQK